MARTRRRKRSSLIRAFATHAIGIAVIAGLIYAAWTNGLLRLPGTVLNPTSQAAFEVWLGQDEGRAADYAAFEGFLAGQDVGEVVPPWQLARVDEDYARRCDLDIWRLPPREAWPNIVPALRLVRDHVVPKMGAVEVQSSYRSPELNVCAGGAARSRHIAFQALDLVLVDRPGDLGQHYRNLCMLQEAAGPDSAMGLGAYYDPSDPLYNREGRFHIDAAGYRSWGRSYTRATSICPRNR